MCWKQSLEGEKEQTFNSRRSGSTRFEAEVRWGQRANVEQLEISQNVSEAEVRWGETANVEQSEISQYELEEEVRC